MKKRIYSLYPTCPSLTLTPSPLPPHPLLLHPSVVSLGGGENLPNLRSSFTVINGVSWTILGVGALSPLTGDPGFSFNRI